MNFSSKLLENAVAEFAKLPGVGQKTALRLVLHLLNQNRQEVEQFSQAITKLRNEIQFCSTCHNISDIGSNEAGQSKLEVELRRVFGMIHGWVTAL